MAAQPPGMRGQRKRYQLLGAAQRLRQAVRGALHRARSEIAPALRCDAESAWRL